MDSRKFAQILSILIFTIIFRDKMSYGTFPECKIIGNFLKFDGTSLYKTIDKSTLLALQHAGKMYGTVFIR